MQIEIEVPDGVSGDWAVQSFSINKEQASLHNLRCLMNFAPSRQTAPGDYKRLVRGKTIVMSNTPAEVNDHLEAIWYGVRSKNVLIHGLGLGMVLKRILESDVPEKIIVVELSEDVIKLVAPTYQDDPRVEIVNDSAFSYKPPKGMRFGMVWHDIWDMISEDNLPEMHKLHRRYGHKTDWQGSWGRWQAEAMRSGRSVI